MMLRCPYEPCADDGSAAGKALAVVPKKDPKDAVISGGGSSALVPIDASSVDTIVELEPPIAGRGREEYA